MKKVKNKHLGKSLTEIFLLIVMTFAVAYFIHETDKNILFEERRKEELNFTKIIYVFFIKLMFDDKNFVSALDINEGVYTCINSKLNKSCQEFPASECSAKCDGVCIPSPRKDVAECKPGTCYDLSKGSCQAGSPKILCEPYGGKWFDDPNGNILECKKGCCIIGSNADLVTQQECNSRASTLGANKEFKSEITNELSCLGFAKTQEEGACVFERDFQKTCKFTNKAECIKLTGSSANFNPGLLCSNPDLKTDCKPQVKSACVEGRDEIYWFDSCGNKENIYDSNKIRSWNDGKILNKANSCLIGSSSNPFSNKGTCGNCDYLLGSICGSKTNSEKLADSKQDFVCRDLSCTDENGNKKAHGESWCAYNSAIGTDIGAGNKLRSADTPGSRHFRQVCIDGEVRTEPCADYRNEICVEAKSAILGGGEFSQAACRINRWQQCLEYNVESARNGNNGNSNEIRDDKCTANPDCFVKEINVDKYFKFNICAPKYPPGFSFNQIESNAEGICSLASQTCTVVYVKKLSGWKCVANCNCLKEGFTQQMNDLCISLGDCGTSVNYIGDLTENYNVKKAKKLTSSYLSALKKYSEIIRGKVAEPTDADKAYGELGIPATLGNVNYNPEKSSFATIGTISGVLGGVMVFAAKSGYILPGLAATDGSIIITKGGEVGGLFQVSPALNGLGNAIGAALIVIAIVSVISGYAGKNGDPVALALSIAVISVALLLGFSLTVVGLIITGFQLLLKFVFGIGKTKKTKVQFACLPWQPVLGGNKCEQCGKDAGNAFGKTALPCSKYSCESLGQTCQFINEGTENELCVNINPNDVNSPIIKPSLKNLQEGFSYSEINDNGFRILSNENDGCLKAYSPVKYGLELNEPGRCRIDKKHTDKFENMEEYFGGSSLFIVEHIATLNIPGLEVLGVSGYDPNRRAEETLYVRCQDKNGNENVNEYTVNFCVKPGEDLTPPIITGRIPESEYVKFDAANLNATILTNEPAECRWDSLDKDYDLMNNNFGCEDDFLTGSICQTNFTINQNENVFYVRCKDQPWLVESNGPEPGHVIVDEIPEQVGEIQTDEDGNILSNEPDGQLNTIEVPANLKRNKNSESYQFVVKRSSSNLKIDSIIPDNKTLKFAVEPASISVEVRTSGGIDGRARCKYGINESLIDFYETLGNVHKQVFQSFSSGDKILPIRCEDIAGNVAEKTAKFKIEIDTSPPIATKVYEQGGVLIIITNEPAECYISDKECGFGIENGRVMNGADLVHSISYNKRLINYVKCKDRYGNVPGSCILKVKGGA